MHRRSSARKCHNALTQAGTLPRSTIHKRLQFSLELIHVRPQRHHIIVVKSLLNILLLHTLLAHVSQTQVNSFSWFFVSLR